MMVGALCFGSVQAQSAYTIYPVPQQVTNAMGNVSLSATINIVAETPIDQTTRQRAEAIFTHAGKSVVFSENAVAGQTNLLLGVHQSGGVATQFIEVQSINKEVFARTAKYDKHLISIRQVDGKDYIVIVGENTDAVFHGLASIEQMLETHPTTLPAVDIQDFADQKIRGLVEGYYGYPYSIAVKKDLMKFMMRMKMNTYLYGAKSDPYHSLYWRDAYPTSITPQQEKEGWLTQDMIKDLSSVSANTKVNFIWAIHPAAASAVNFSSQSTAETGVTDVARKLEMMYQLGVRQFAVFVDDAGQNISHRHNYAHFFTKLQQRLDATYNTVGKAATDTVKPLHVVPHVYTLTWVGESDRNQYFEALSHTPSKIVYYTTGWGVWSVPNSRDLQTMKTILGREVAWWWNYPCNDNADSRIYTCDTYTNFGDAPSIDSNAKLPAELQNGLGVVSNPMQQGEVSKIALFSVANYAWNNAKFNNYTSWQATINHLFAPEKRAAIKTFLEHARHNNSASFEYVINAYKRAFQNTTVNTTTLEKRLTDIITSCEVVRSLENSDNESDRLFFQDVKPWLAKLETMATVAKELVAVRKSSEPSDTWSVYLRNLKKVNTLDTSEVYKAYALEGHGTGISVSVRPATPSHQHLEPFVRFMAENAYNHLFPARKLSTTVPTFITNRTTLSGTVTTSVAGQYSISKTVTLATGQYVGIALPVALQLNSIVLGDAVKQLTAYYSSDAKQWKKVVDGTPPSSHVRYCVLVNETAGDVSVTLNASNFCLRFPHVVAPSVITIPSGNIWQEHNKELMADGNYNTFCVVNKNQAQGDAYMYTFNTPVAVHDVRVYVGTTNGDHYNVANIQVSNDGNTWTSLPIKGTSVTDATMARATRYTDDVSYCDFEGTGEAYKYVRLYVKQAYTNKWLRLYEMEINRLHIEKSKQTIATLANGDNISEVADNKMNNFFTLPQQGSLVYRLVGREQASNLVVLQDASALNGASLSLKVSADSIHWHELGTLSQDYTNIDLTTAPANLRYAVFTWQGVQPVIHEIGEVSNGVLHPVSIFSVRADKSKGIAPKVQVLSGGISIEADTAIKAVSIVQLDGRIALAQTNAVATNRMLLPKAGISHAGYVLRVQLSNGQVYTYKLLK